MLFTATMDRLATVRTFAIHRLHETDASIPRHSLGAATSRAVGFVDRDDSASGARKWALIHTRLAMQLRAVRTLGRLDNGARLNLLIINRALAAEGLLDGDALAILSNGIFGAIQLRHNNAA